MKGRTTIIIAHRLSTIRRMDRILMLDQGCLVQDGAHDELLRIENRGMYWNLWTTQQLGFIADVSEPDPTSVPT